MITNNSKNKTALGDEPKAVKKKNIQFVSSNDIYLELKEALNRAFFEVLDKYNEKTIWNRLGTLQEIGCTPVSEFYSITLNKSKKKRICITISYRVTGE